MLPAEETSGDTAQDSDTGASSSRWAPYLFQIMDADRPAAGGRRWPLAGVDEVFVGRAESDRAVREGRTLSLGFPGRTLSSRHARLRQVRGQWELEDLGSRNGTFLVEQRLSRPTVVQDGQFFEMGRCFFVLRSGPEVEPASLLGSIDPMLIQQTQGLLQVARSDVPILVLGETGTGKEVHARAVHEASARRGRFVAVNCGALPTTMVEAQMFGHVRGAFTGAMRDEPGLVRTADGGTLFLDEIGDLGATAQAALLRVLQEREVLPIGARTPIRVDLRIVAATHRDLDAEVAAGRFRDDLLARLRGYEHALVPLRRRRNDLGQLLSALIRDGQLPERFDLAPAAVRRLLSYSFPHNVRELRQIVAAAAALSPGGTVTASQLPGRLSAPPPSPPSTPPLREPIDAELRARLVEALRAHTGNVAAVARAFEKAPAQIHRWMKKMSLDPDDYR